MLWILGIAFIVVPLFILSSGSHHTSAIHHSSGTHHATKAPPIWFGAVFSLVGLFILWQAVYASIAVAKYGRSIFESPWLPAACGGILTGTIRIARPLLFREPIHIRLTCVERTRSGKNSQEHLLWQDSCTLDRFSPGAAVADFPVYFKIPAGIRPMWNGSVTWRLQAKAKTDGVHYAASFVVPVSLETPLDLPDLPDPTLPFRSPEAARRQPMDRHLHFNPLPGGGGQFELMPGRNLGLAIGFIVFGTVFIGGAIVFSQFLPSTNQSHVPNWFPLIFIAVGALVAFVGMRLLLLKTTIDIRHGVISINNTIGPLDRRREIEAADISDISVKLQGQSGNRPFYGIAAIRTAGGSTNICGTIYDKGDADWIAAEIKRELQGF
ncbi:MAG TPA: hypothetical protein VGG44_09025 [Tepidisphaeraceae bacterium]|jgi:hypothetical protein